MKYQLDQAAPPTQSALIRQFLAESLPLSFGALALAFVLIEFLLPAFNSLTGRALSLQLFTDGVLAVGMIGIAFVVGLVSGSYPRATRGRTGVRRGEGFSFSFAA